MTTHPLWIGTQAASVYAPSIPGRGSPDPWQHLACVTLLLNTPQMLHDSQRKCFWGRGWDYLHVPEEKYKALRLGASAL